MLVGLLLPALCIQQRLLNGLALFEVCFLAYGDFYAAIHFAVVATTLFQRNLPSKDRQAMMPNAKAKARSSKILGEK